MKVNIHDLLKTGFCLAAFVLFSECRRETNIQPQPDPCADALSNPLTFKILDQINGQYFESDSVFVGTTVFEAPTNYTSFRWHLGFDTTTFRARRFSLNFADAVGTISVRLIAKRPLNIMCFPHDTGIDTLIKSLTILPENSLVIPPTAIEGRYQGANTDSPTDTFTIRVRRVALPSDPSQQRLVLLNLNRGCSASPVDVSWGYKGFSLYQQNPGYSITGCDFVTGVGFLDLKDRNKIRLDYTQRASGTAASIAKTFVGKRL